MSFSLQLRVTEGLFSETSFPYRFVYYNHPHLITLFFPPTFDLTQHMLNFPREKDLPWNHAM